jgi:hypothetical protein
MVTNIAKNSLYCMVQGFPRCIQGFVSY